MALGAQSGDVRWQTVREGAALTLAGAVIGFAGAVLVSRALTTVLFGVDPMDPLTFGSVAVLLAGVAACASYLPARRATLVDPMVALRAE
jgi:putative ABC transport system permease protein